MPLMVLAAGSYSCLWLMKMLSVSDMSVAPLRAFTRAEIPVQTRDIARNGFALVAAPMACRAANRVVHRPKRSLKGWAPPGAQ
jgi:hypothetical protein